MTNTRLIQASCPALLLAAYLSAAVPASARPAPPPEDTGTATPLPGPPTYPSFVHDHVDHVVVHDHVSPWAYLLITSLAVLTTLVIVTLVVRLRRVSSGRRTTVGPAAV
jgi:hypothetical protein